MKPKPLLILVMPALLFLPACATLAGHSIGSVAVTENETGKARSDEKSGNNSEEKEAQVYGPTPIMPVITTVHQGFVYGPGQLVLAFAEGFQPNENLSVSVVHTTQGTIKSELGQANTFGQMIIYHYVQDSQDDEGAYPPGNLSYQVSGDQGTEKSYAFIIDHSIEVQPSPITGCGVYPQPPIQLGDTFVTWCGGMSPDEPHTTFSISMDGEVLYFTKEADVLSDGIGLIWIETESSDLEGTWYLSFGQKSYPVDFVP